MQGEEGGGRRTHILLDLVIIPLATHPFRDGAPLLLLKGETGGGVEVKSAWVYLRVWEGGGGIQSSDHARSAGP